MNGGLVLHHLHLKAMHFFAFLKQRNRSDTNSRIAFRLGESSDGPLLLCMNYTMIVFIGNMPSLTNLIKNSLNRNMHVILCYLCFF